MVGGKPDQRSESDSGFIDADCDLFASVLTDPLVVARKRRETSSPLADVPADRRAILGRAINALVEAGFGFNSTPVAGVVSMQRAWQGSGEDLVMVDVVTLDTEGQGLAVREGVSGRPVWGPERGEWSAVVAAVLSRSAPQGFARVAAREHPVPEADEHEGLLGSVLGQGRPLVAGLVGEEGLDVG